VRDGGSISKTLGGLDHGVGDVGRSTRAASTTTKDGLGLLGLTGGLVTLELALGLGAGGGLLALPVALGLLAHGGADGLGGNTGGTAVSGRADSLALGAVVLLAHVLGATDVTLGLVAVDLALGTSSFFTLDLALGALAHGVALGGADGVVALPSALGVALGLGFKHGGAHGSQKENRNEEEELHLVGEEEEKDLILYIFSINVYC